ncbi:unnamed protein product, partial [Adineta steineri]
STTISICNFTACNSQRTSCSSNRNCECFSLTISPSVGICASAVLSCTDVVRCNTDNRTCPIENTVCVNSTRCGQPVCYPLALANKLVCPIKTTAATTTATTVRTTATTHAGGVTNTTRSTTKAITATDSRFTPSTANCSSIVATNCTTTTSIVAACQSYEVSWNNHCYYLDGSNGSCITDSTTISICNFTACNSQRTPCSSNRNCECFSLTINPSVGICASAMLSCTDVVRCNTDNRTCPIENTVCVNSTRCGQPVCYPLALANKLVCPINTTAATTTTTHAGGLTNTTRSTTKAITTTDSRFTPSTANSSSIVATNCTTTTSIVAACQSYEVSWNNHCYYLDGSNGSCITGY